MNLSDYAAMDKTGGGTGDFIKFEKTGDVKYLRFMYESGGDEMGKDVVIRKKAWNDITHKYEYDTPEGKSTACLEAIEYNADGSNPRYVRWDRSAYFCANTLLPAWRNYPRIIDGVWKITATNPGTMEASFSMFPVMGADTIKFPIIPRPDAQSTPVETVPTAQAQPAPKKKYWEV